LSTKGLADLCAPYTAYGHGAEEIALLDLPGKDEPANEAVGVAVYTTPDDKAQREHLLTFRNVAEQGVLGVYPVTHEELLETLQRHTPTSVLFDGQEVPGGEVVELIKEALGLSIKHSPIRSRQRILWEP
jgi:hypothetical protein